MRVELVGTDHANEEESMLVLLEYVGIGREDDWTFTIGNHEVTISNLVAVMDFLKANN